MVLKLGNYRLAKPGLMKMYFNMQEPDVITRIGSIAVATHTPIIVIHAYVLEDFGPNTEVEVSMERLIRFYGITEIIE